MRAIILAAGMGSRLEDLTKSLPKCLLKINEVTLLDYQLSILKHNQINDIHIITGFQNDKIIESTQNKYNYHFYPDFKITNNLHTLGYHSNLLEKECVILFSDVLIKNESFKNVIDDKNDFSLLVDTNKCDESTMRILIKENFINDIGSHIDPNDGDGNFIGIAKFSKSASNLLKNKINFLVNRNENINDYYTEAVRELIKSGFKISPVDIGKLPWIEIDTVDEYKSALKSNLTYFNEKK